MKTLLLKEARLLLPVWVAALLLAVAGPWLNQPLLWFGLGIVLLAVTPFGMEFSHGTFALLLVQPVPRRRIWRVKLFTLTLAVGSVLSVFYLSFWCRLKGAVYAGDSISAAAFGLVLVLVIVAGGLWTTLLLRQIAAAIWLTALVPAFLVLVLDALTDTFHKEGSFVPCVVVLIVYAVLGVIGARWLFQNAQDAQWTGGTVAVPLQRLWPTRAQADSQTKPRPRWLALLVKELYLHQPGLLLVGAAAALHVAVILVRAFSKDTASAQAREVLEFLALAVWCLWWFVVPVMFGAMAVAEERKLGTLEGHLCLPISRRAQFIAKFAVVLLLSVVFAALLPKVLEEFGAWMGVFNGPDLSKNTWRVFIALTTVVSLSATVSFYASTMTRNTLQALGVAVLLGVVCMLFAQLAWHPGHYLGIPLWEGRLFHMVTWPLMLPLTLWMAYVNCKRLHEGNRTVVRNIMVLIGALLGVTTVTALTYHRVWEFAIPLEPEHGSARISRSGTTKLCWVGGADKAFVLLPDGRLWSSADFLTGEMMGFKQWKEGMPWTPANYLATQMAGFEHWKDRTPPSGHGFLPGSNWVEVAATDGELVAMKGDGSLWSVFRCERDTSNRLVPGLDPSRIGSDTNWISLAAGGWHFLAVKRDGTLWGWRENSQWVVNPPKFKQVPARIGGDTDWEACFASGDIALVAKRDGSGWKWGRLASRIKVDAGQAPALTGPVRVNLPSKGLKAITKTSLIVALYEDGSLWVLPYQRTIGTVSPYRLDTPETWLQASFGKDYLATIRRDGTLWKLPKIWDSKDGWRLDWRHAVKAYQRSDWVAVSAHHGYLLALGADGKLCEWREPESRGPYDLLRPTRRYVGSVNIFDTPTTVTKAAP